MSTPPIVSDVVPGLKGRGVILADHTDLPDVALALISAGYVVRELDGAHVVQRSQALPALADALHLPGAADHNLDALLDSLRDLPDLWPGRNGVVLLWRSAEQFIEGDPQVWEQIEQILTLACLELAPNEFAFETVAFVEGYDLAPLLLGVPHDKGPVL
ncbi:barstar family protein [Austwickia chelonae]|uniref:barstar family protein n=1 Tax=Austwickia chelonae TaxID=100225 RepID=UPI000E24B2BB|nr:barstar family protein [Austwickia chelonae]